MKNIIGSLVLFFALVHSVPEAMAADDHGLPGEFLNYAGARTLGMGRAFTGLADDVDSIYWNPAGLATYRSSQLAFQYAPDALGGSHQDFAYSQPIRRLGSLGFGVVNVQTGDVPRVDANNIENGSFQHRETDYQMSYGYRLKNVLSLGGTFKMDEKITDGRSARGFGADVGGLYMLRENVRFGAMVRNLLAPSYTYDTEKEVYPTLLRAGGSMKFFGNHLTGAMDLEKSLGTPQGVQWHLGAEGFILDSIILRFGIDTTEYAMGIGVKWKNLEFDYAAGFQNLGLANRTSIKVVFGGYEVDVKASPRVFSPTGLKNKTQFSINAGNRERVTNWILAVRSANGEVVRSFNGYNSPPKALEWDGMDANGRAVPEGEYSYRMSVTDNKNITEMTPTRSLKIVAPTPLEIESK